MIDDTSQTVLIIGTTIRERENIHQPYTEAPTALWIKSKEASAEALREINDKAELKRNYGLGKRVATPPQCNVSGYKLDRYRQVNNLISFHWERALLLFSPCNSNSAWLVADLPSASSGDPRSGDESMRMALRIIRRRKEPELAVHL